MRETSRHGNNIFVATFCIYWFPYLLCKSPNKQLLDRVCKWAEHKNASFSKRIYFCKLCHDHERWLNWSLIVDRYSHQMQYVFSKVLMTAGTSWWCTPSSWWASCRGPSAGWRCSASGSSPGSSPYPSSSARSQHTLKSLRWSCFVAFFEGTINQQTRLSSVEN